MRKIRFSSLLILLLLFCACSYVPKTGAYRSFYSHLKFPVSDQQMQESPFFLVILVEARHLDYTHPHSFFKTLAKHPSDGSKNGDVGHAWIHLQGIASGEMVCLEGGHSGELGILQPRYMEGVFLRYEQGSDDPIAYLWETQPDGFFQYGSGKHNPTFAAKVDLTEAQFNRILRFVQTYDFTEYAITGNQCSSFAAQAAAFADLQLDCEITIQVDPYLYIGGKKLCLWRNPDYSEITFSSPDILERSLMQAVREGRADAALCWYRNTHQYKSKWNVSDWMLFPKRYLRFKTL